MAPLTFEVEQAAMIAWDLPVVVARPLAGGAPAPDAPEVTVGEASTLGGCPVMQVTAIGRARRADGTPRPPLYAFALLSEADLARFAPGQVVVLQG